MIGLWAFLVIIVNKIISIIVGLQIPSCGGAGYGALQIMLIAICCHSWKPTAIPVQVALLSPAI